MDEALALPSEKAVEIALRTQQVIAFESGVTNSIDPFGGSYLMESLTNRLEQEAEEYFERIEKMGGVVAAIEKGFLQKEITEAAYQYQMSLSRRKKFQVGVTRFVNEDEKLEIPVLVIDEAVERDQLDRLSRVRGERDNEAVSRRLGELKDATGSEGEYCQDLFLYE